MRISAVVLAAGSARRFGSDKLKADLDGKSVMHRVLEALAGFSFHEIVMVVRPGWDIEAGGIGKVENLRADEGMATSLALGISSLKACDAAFVVLADMPFLPPAIFADLTRHLPQHDIIVPRHEGQNGHPVLFSSVCFAELQTLSGDRGGRSLIESGHYRVACVEVAEDGILRDIDRPADLRR